MSAIQLLSPTLKRLALSFFLLFFVPNTSLFAQQIIKGIVTDAETGDPLIGVSILLKGTGTGTVSDVDGFFRLKVADSTKHLLVISYTGYQQQEITIGPEKKIKIGLLQVPVQDSITWCGGGGYITLFPFAEGAIKKIKPKAAETPGAGYASQLLQGKVAGLIVSRKGGDPNEDYFLRLRGISSFSMRNSPLIVVDGLPEASLYTLDPNDIASIKILKDAASSAKYGVLGNAGAVEINTRKYNGNEPRFRYRTYVQRSWTGKKIPLADKKRFLSAGGTDLGGETDWIGEITQSPISQGHYLSTSDYYRGLEYHVSGGYRSAQGILRKSGFEQYNGRVAFRFEPIKNKLQISSHMSLVRRNINHSFRQAFYNASLMNPTAPVKIFEEEYEKYNYYYFQQRFYIPSTDTFYISPVANIEQNVSIGRLKEKSSRLKVAYNINSSHKIHGFVGGRKREYISGHASVPVESWSKENIDSRQLHYNISHQYKTKIGRIFLKQETGYASHLVKEKSKFQFARKIRGASKLSFSNLEKPLDIDSSELAFTLRSGGGHRISSFFSNSQINAKYWDLNAHIRYEGLSYWSYDEYTDREHALFYGFTFGLDLIPWPFFNNFNEAKLRLGYGKTGSVFASNNINIDRRPMNISIYKDRNNWIGKKELNIGIDFVLGNKKLYGSIDLYNNLVTDPTFTIMGAELINSGLEADINIKVIRNNPFSWTTGLQFSTNKTVMRDVETFKNELFFTWREDGQEADLMIAYVAKDELENGGYAPLDLNGDGVIEFEKDIKTIGHAFPKYIFGWQNQFDMGNFRLRFDLRSMIGHKLYNYYRHRNEINDASENNIVVSKYFREDITRRADTFFDRYFEKGDFLKLDYINLGYDIPLKKAKLHIYLAAHNLLTWSGYTGSDPEPRFFDRNSNYSDETDIYYRSKSFLLGADFSF
ncbi:MAG TPA: hypothetical protein ENJ95_10095 [Bacteroidetes bacterium]|nr:hypothetical protein [Bacteroidota bacterium]